jgi:hypothetical protein
MMTAAHQFNGHVAQVKLTARPNAQRIIGEQNSHFIWARK